MTLYIYIYNMCMSNRSAKSAVLKSEQWMSKYYNAIMEGFTSIYTNESKHIIKQELN